MNGTSAIYSLIDLTAAAGRIFLGFSVALFAANLIHAYRVDDTGLPGHPSDRGRLHRLLKGVWSVSLVVVVVGLVLSGVLGFIGNVTGWWDVPE